MLDSMRYWNNAFQVPIEYCFDPRILCTPKRSNKNTFEHWIPMCPFWEKKFKDLHLQNEKRIQEKEIMKLSEEHCVGKIIPEWQLSTDLWISGSITVGSQGVPWRMLSRRKWIPINRWYPCVCVCVCMTLTFLSYSWHNLYSFQVYNPVIRQYRAY